MAPEKILTLPSQREEVYKIEKFVRSLRDEMGFEESHFNRVMLSLSEAVNNAIKHGNNENPDKKVEIRAEWEGLSLTIEVEDEGEGFDPDSLPDPREPENILNESGRGVFLMEQYADNVIYKDDGSIVTLIFNLD